MPTPLEEQLLKQRLAVNQTMAGVTGQGQLTQAPMAVAPGAFRLNPQVPDPQGLMKAMQAAGLKGQRNEDIELPVSLEELMARAKALEGNRTDFLNSARDVAPSNTSELNRLYDINKGGR